MAPPFVFLNPCCIGKVTILLILSFFMSLKSILTLKAKRKRKRCRKSNIESEFSIRIGEVTKAQANAMEKFFNRYTDLRPSKVPLFVVN